ncbi:DUF6412 domain-containing protein [Streptomyces clavuligerus]|uniref:Uncharacterized protein n=1 Tax=Streptomyces clavuligerus TaxID=1901 RepID=E2Q528_STRCL|nr:DUF6412 domain-containing protein [Streptomyces clavuligerus]ANW20033.1 hypothetical protein BB341_18340 [Streptomyces clavuligerus]AXU14660.1 hypothetical protein D1794_19155 [Streptomyces clavuligerus]EFG07069.1 Hypothetical protein SCLAV_1996 [Streptomyces clavuligerus]MBY6304680.1 hypothetical protein [Streptomyces clavuligerus]QCS07430.1 hypothetical protein CRV15_18510 [Streptomyces clavuligerus]
MEPKPLARALKPAVLALLIALELLLLDGSGLTALLALTATATATTAAAATALLVCAVISARCVPVVPRARVRTAIRDREQRTAFLPQRDPDARGRTRPRAPGRPLPTAA